MILLFKASLVVMFLLSFYKLFLERESFFKANRIYLLACLALACALPFVVLPKMIDHQGYVDNLFELVSPNLTEKTTQEAQLQVINESSTTQKDSESETENTSVHAATEINSETPTTSDDITDNKEGVLPIDNTKKTTSKGWSFWILCIYLFGVIILTINLIGQIFNVVLKVIRNDDQIEDEEIVIVNMKGDVEPCSFFKYIFINPESYDFDTYEQIIAHEKVHVEKGHSIDLLLSEIAVIILWFNPFVWLLRKEVEKNIEYQTDEALVTNELEIKESYQLNLVKIACNTSPLAITTNYNQSLIKQRILRMNAKKSNKFNYWKYAFCLPLVFVLMLILNRPFDSTAQIVDLMTELPVDNNTEEQRFDVNLDSLNEITSKQPLENEPEVENNTANIKTSKKGDNISIESELIANCEEFEKAVADGDLVKVKEILKTLDPDCLKIKKNEKSNLNAVENLIKNKKAELKLPQNEKSTKLENEKIEICDRLRDAVTEKNRNKTKKILLDEDISCLTDMYGNPSNSISLIKGLLSYNSKINFHSDNTISIHEIYFEIGIEDYEAQYCQDPKYLRLAKAIKEDDEPKIRELLSEGGMICPLNENGVRNDFIFIKELMKYNPIITNQNRQGIRVGGVGIEIDMNGYGKQLNPYSKDYLYSNNKQEDLLSDIEKSLPSSKENGEEISCVELIDAIASLDKARTYKLINLVDLDCFHRITRTLTNDEGESLKTSTVNTPLIAAIRKEDLGLVKLLLEKNADINYSGNGKATPLIAAVLSRNTKIIKLIVDSGAEINRRDEANFTALYYAKYQDLEEITKYLLSKGAK